MASRRTTAGPSTRVLTVDDLLQRHGAAAPVPPAVRPAPGVRVVGRAGPSARLPQRAAIAAGALLAAGSVVAAAVATTVPPAADPARVDAGPADPGPAAPAVPAVPDLAPTAGGDRLDPGTAPDDAWLRVAFPGSRTPDPVPSTDRSATAATADAPAAAPADDAGTDDDTPAAAGADDADDADDEADGRARDEDDRDDDRGQSDGNGRSGEDGKNGDGRGGRDGEDGDDADATSLLVDAVTDLL